MEIGFDNISDHTIPMDDFSLKWRFTEERYDKLPKLHLDQLKPVDEDAARFLLDHINSNELYKNFPFKKHFFKNIETAKIVEGQETDTRTWLSRHGIAPDKEVCLSWDSGTAMIAPWELFIKYFDAFFYPGSDDLTIVDQHLSWALLFFHTNDIYFGTRNNFVSSDISKD